MKTERILFSALLLAIFIFTGCSPALTVRLAPDDAVSMQFESGTGAELTKTFTALTGQQISQIDTSSAVKAMRKAGLSPDTITQKGPDLCIATGPDAISSILSNCPGTIQSSKTDSSFSITLSPETAQYIIGLLPEETASYTELFMAPLFTGESMSPDEYTDLVAAVYGNPLASELASSRFTLSISVPGTVSSISVPANLKATCSKSGETALVSIPLSSLLTLSQAQSILVFFDKTKYTN